MSDVIERFDPPTSDDVENNMEALVSTLMLLNGMTKRGGALTPEYRAKELQSIRRFATRIFDALEKGEPAVQPWDYAKKAEAI